MVIKEKIGKFGFRGSKLKYLFEIYLNGVHLNIRQAYVQ